MVQCNDLDIYLDGGLGKYMGGLVMYHFEYVSKENWQPVKNNLESILQQVRNIVYPYFPINYQFIGSSSRNMITQDIKSNIGFDFDVNIEVNYNIPYKPNEIRNILRQAIDQVARKYNYDYCEDSTRVLTIKVKDKINSRIIHSCDFCIVRNYTDREGYFNQDYIRFNKPDYYCWEMQSNGFFYLPDRIQWIKNSGIWNELRNCYLKMKNNNQDTNKHSRSILAEAVNQICVDYGYFDEDDDDEEYDDWYD